MTSSESVMLLRDAGSGSDESASSSLPPASHRSRRFRTAPLMTPKMPPGVPNVIVNEAAERFSFYGMKGILVVFMTHHLRDAAGRPDVLSEAAAREYYHAFTSAVYLTPIGGALLAEGVIGKYRTIVYLSVVYCGGHLVLALNETRAGLVGGLFLIALGSGGIKPCVSAVLGDQFGEMNQHLMSSTFAYFYLAINFGAFTSTLLTPYLLEHVGSHAAFGVPGVAMAVATLVFWSGRYKYAHVPADRRFCRETCSKEGAVLLGRLLGLFVFFAAFWSLCEDHLPSSPIISNHLQSSPFISLHLPSSPLATLSPLAQTTSRAPRGCCRRRRWTATSAASSGCPRRSYARLAPQTFPRRRPSPHTLPDARAAATPLRPGTAFGLTLRPECREECHLWEARSSPRLAF